MKELSLTPDQLAEKIDIEVDFVTVLLDGNFPVSELHRGMLSSLATALQCTVENLVWAMDVDDNLR